MPYVPFDPNKPLTPATPAAPTPPPVSAAPDGQGKGGYVPFDPNQGQTGGDQSKQTPPSDDGWGISGWSGDVKMPQSVQDWSTIAGNESTMNLLGLRAQAEAARQRLGPAAAASADVAGSVLSPTSLAYAIPYAGPALAGGLHEGIKSYGAGNDWTTVGKDTAAGAAAGLVGQGVAKAAPAVLPQLTKAAVDLGPAAAMTYGAHKLFGDPSKDILGALGGYTLMHNLSEGAGETAKSLAASPLTQQAIKSLILGGNAAIRASSPGPLWNQWQ